ncbi:Fucolectin [Lamellibrachia satsuma]|nr:Fucolectin [Lamellibrachia satsuma]
MRIEALDVSAIHTCAVVKNDWGKGTKQFPCMPGTKGSKVKITLTGKAQLYMCEVQVFGTQVQEPRVIIDVSASANGTSQRCATIQNSFLENTQHITCPAGMKGRFVKITVLGQNQSLSLCEVQVYGIAGRPSGLLGMDTYSSIPYKSTDPSKTANFMDQHYPIQRQRDSLFSHEMLRHPTDVKFMSNVKVNMKPLCLNNTECVYDYLKMTNIELAMASVHQASDKATFEGAMKKAAVTAVDDVHPLLVVTDTSMLKFPVNLLATPPVHGVPPQLIATGSNLKKPEVDWTKNLAKGRPAKQSTTLGTHYSAGKAVDGNRNSNMTKRSCTHTKSEAGSWWQVDLDGTYQIRKVVITNRGDCCENRLKSFVIEVQQHENLVHICASSEAALKKGETKSFLCKRGSIGNIVRIKLTGTEILSLCEVEVFGILETPEVDWTKNLAKGKPAKQSTTFGKHYSAGKAVDGNRNSNMMKRSCTHTNREAGSWWQVDLYGIYEIRQVVITNRGDCCGNRLKSFVIEVQQHENLVHICASSEAALKKGETKSFLCKRGSIGNIVRIKLKGTEVLSLCEVEVFGILGQMAAVAVDSLRGRIYWSDHSKNTITRAALDGSNQTVIVNAGYRGCYLDQKSSRALQHRVGDMHKTNSPMRCVSKCVQNGHTLAGMEAAYACFCGKAIRNPTSKPTTDCKMPCLGDGSQMCGGVFRLSVYDTKRLVVHGLAVDALTGKIYFTYDNKVEVVNTDGTQRARVIVHSHRTTTFGVAVDVVNRLLFHSTQYPAGVYKSGLDGTAAVKIVSSGLQTPWGMAIDYSHRQICWADAGMMCIQCTDNDGRNPKQVYTTGGVRYVDVKDNTLYYSQRSPNRVYACRLDVASCRVLNTGTGTKTGIAVLSDNSLYDCQSKNPCKTILRDSTFRHKDDDKFVRCTKSGSCTVLSCSNRKKYIPISGTCSK